METRTEQVTTATRQAPVAATPVRITDTTLRDAHQSLWATRMRRKDIEGIIDVIDSVGYYTLEVWGGATFDVCLRFLREDPWERLRFIKSRAKTPTQMLLRAQNLVGYRNYADDLVDRFVALACKNGMDVFRIFDALNDTRNLESAIKAVKKYGGHAQGTLCYAISPVHTVEAYLEYAREQVQLGIDSLAVKDMAGILDPMMTEKLVSGLKREFPNVPLQLHTHSSSGMAMSVYYEGVRNGAGAIDCAIAPMAGFSSQPAVETMEAIFANSGFDPGLDKDALEKVANYFSKLHLKRRQTKEALPYIDRQIVLHQIPGGMISNFRSQLAQQKALDKLPEVFEEVAQVRKDLGYPPLVTPMSQIVGTQAVMNVLAGERYKLIPNEVKNYARGLYGRAPAHIDPELMKKILGDEKPITHRPADTIAPELPNAADDVDPELIQSEEDIISFAIMPEPALAFFKWRALPEAERPLCPADEDDAKAAAAEKNGAANGAAVAANGAAANGSDKATAPATVAVAHGNGNGGAYGGALSPSDYQGLGEVVGRLAGVQFEEVTIRKGDFALRVTAPLSGGFAAGPGGLAMRSLEGTVPPPVAVPAPPAPESHPATNVAPDPDEVTYAHTIKAPLTGNFYVASGPGKPPFVKVGDIVDAGDKVCVVEAMKLFNEIRAPEKCKIVKFLVEDATQVEKDQPIIAYDVA